MVGPPKGIAEVRLLIAEGEIELYLYQAARRESSRRSEVQSLLTLELRPLSNLPCLFDHCKTAIWRRTITSTRGILNHVAR